MKRRRDPFPRMSTKSDWCHKTVDFVTSYCGIRLPPGEPNCGTGSFPKIGTCGSCGRPRCPECVMEARRP